MSCSITKGRKEKCKKYNGGIKAIYIENFDDVAGHNFLINPDGTLGDFVSPPDLYLFELKGNNNTFVEAITTSRENGSTVYAQTLTINLKGLDKETSEIVHLLAQGLVRIYVHFNNGETVLMGEAFGADLTAGSIQSGGAKADLFGYSGLVFSAEETKYANFIGGSTVFDPFVEFDTKPIIISE